MTRIYIGIDGGKSGALVAMDEHLEIVDKIVMPVIGKKKEYDVAAIHEWLSKFTCFAEDKVSVILEKSLIIPVSGRISVASTAFCQGMMYGILTSLKIPFQVVSPVEWKKTVLRGADWKKNKGSSILWAKQKFPQESWKRTEKCTKDHDGLTDACCMAYYGYQLENRNI